MISGKQDKFEGFFFKLTYLYLSINFGLGIAASQALVVPRTVVASPRLLRCRLVDNDVVGVVL